MICSTCQFLWSRCHWSQNWKVMCTIDWWASFSSPPGTAITHLWLCLVLATTANVIMKVRASGYRNVQRLWKSKDMLWVGIMRRPRNNMLGPGQHVRSGSHLGHEVKGGSSEAFLPPNIFLSDLFTSTVLCLNYLCPFLSPNPRSSTSLQILRIFSSAIHYWPVALHMFSSLLQG